MSNLLDPFARYRSTVMEARRRFECEENRRLSQLTELKILQPKAKDAP